MFDEKQRHRFSMPFEIEHPNNEYWDVHTRQYYTIYYPDCPKGFRMYNDVVCGK